MAGSNNLFSGFSGKKIVITGHTGFKGSWLVNWLLKLGANITGISLPPDSNPSFFDLNKLNSDVENHFMDIRNRENLIEIFNKTQPDYVFHLAAQSLVSLSHLDPAETIEINTLGTVNVLESLRHLQNKCSAVFVTSDKCYENLEWIWGYRENDRLGGKDPYSASKASAEIIINAYMHSFFSKSESDIRVASARAGNVIGGGDWSVDRIIPDCIRAWSKNKKVEIRSTGATRPWQHVIEPIGGYLNLAQKLDQNSLLNGQAFNFGPAGSRSRTVKELVQSMSETWVGSEWVEQENNHNQFNESNLLSLNTDKTTTLLGWQNKLSFQEIVEMTSYWYQMFYSNPQKIENITLEQITNYTKLISEKNT